MEIGLIENLQREDLNPAEEARGFKVLLEEYGLTQEQLAQRMGKSRPAVANTLRLLALPDEIMAMLEEGTLSAGHARAILPLPSPEAQLACAKKVIDGQLSVRQTEALVKALSRQPKEKPKTDQPDIALYLGELEKDLSGTLGRKVKIAHKGKKGKIELEYYSDEDLEVLLAALKSMRGGV
jgi:ParB family chromosome partitioning protein